MVLGGLTRDELHVVTRELHKRGGAVIADERTGRAVLLGPLLALGDLPGILQNWGDATSDLGKDMERALLRRSAGPYRLAGPRDCLMGNAAGIAVCAPDLATLSYASLAEDGERWTEPWIFVRSSPPVGPESSGTLLVELDGTTDDALAAATAVLDALEADMRPSVVLIGYDDRRHPPARLAEIASLRAAGRPLAAAVSDPQGAVIAVLAGADMIIGDADAVELAAMLRRWKALGL